MDSSLRMDNLLETYTNAMEARGPANWDPIDEDRKTELGLQMQSDLRYFVPDYDEKYPMFTNWGNEKYSTQMYVTSESAELLKVNIGNGERQITILRGVRKLDGFIFHAEHIDNSTGEVIHLTVDGDGEFSEARMNLNENSVLADAPPSEN